MGYFGRRKIFTTASEITRDNVVAELKSALDVHDKNSREIDYLFQYYKGKQPIYDRVKTYNTEINNKICVNRASEIVTFKTGYLLAQPIQYTNRGASAENSELTQIDDSINALNNAMYDIGKSSLDRELVDWMHICGVGNRIALPDEPFNVYNLDPRYSFVCYRADLEETPLFGVKYISQINGEEQEEILYSVWTDNAYYEILDDELILEESRYYGSVPMVEYPANRARMGAFEACLPLLDAINTIESNRVDGIEQFVQALLLFKNCDIDTEEFKALRELGGLRVPENGDVSYLVQEMNQTQTQALVDDCYDAILTICGMPNRNGGSSTSDTGAASILRDGWFTAESFASGTEQAFTQSEKRLLKLILTYCETLSDINLSVSNIAIVFPRKNYQNNLEQAEILKMMLPENFKIHPQLAFAYCGAFSDSVKAYTMSKEYTDENAETEQIGVEETTAEGSEEEEITTDAEPNT